MNLKLKILAASVPLLAIGALTAPCVAQATTPVTKSAGCSSPVTVAHRGGNEKYVENTRNAWNYSMSNGADWVETDVQFTSDHYPVIMHDPTVDRTTSGTGTVGDMTLAQVRALRTADGQQVPSFYEYLSDVKAHGKKAMPELKMTPRNETEWHNFLVRFDWLGMKSSSLVYSFDGAAVQRAQTAGLNTAIIDQLGDRPASFITNQGTHVWLKHEWSVTYARNQAWLAGGVTTYAWTADSPSDWSYLRADKVAGIITDKPVAYEAWTNAQC